MKKFVEIDNEIENEINYNDESPIEQAETVDQVVENPVEPIYDDVDNDSEIHLEMIEETERLLFGQEKEKEDDNRAKSIREKVNKNQEKNAELMERKHNKKRNKRTLEFELDDKVTVLIPRIDRGGSDLPRIPGIILRKTGDKDIFHEIVCKFGILNEKLRACDLEPFEGLLEFDHKTIKNKISLREAARLNSNRLIDLKNTQNVCKCSGKCDGRCSCFRSKQKCGSHCHLGT
ncbi:unnamed protein product [Brachionus calyciflorus]|uniref:Uncharacterized protein n=1 Tax=Brachionus calyciflorus TaxID=104777 RepID=A0A814IYM5_9BILA|nr:unnamed protein product [Brachionus calyciflorus]